MAYLLSNTVGAACFCRVWKGVGEHWWAAHLCYVDFKIRKGVQVI